MEEKLLSLLMRDGVMPPSVVRVALMILERAEYSWCRCPECDQVVQLYKAGALGWHPGCTYAPFSRTMTHARWLSEVAALRDGEHVGDSA